jgi:hypothetical protein
MLGPIGNDILDIGSRKATMARAVTNAADPLGLGRPRQFEVSNVSDVRCRSIECAVFAKGIVRTNLRRAFNVVSNTKYCLFAYVVSSSFSFSKSNSPPCTFVPTFDPLAVTRIPIKK